ncbi:uncharacterized protein LOC143022663 isoform X4 [Oratosquilla oratoria]|uniref:uncharacterized protein LOC143022663 isoform X4 n=1 Tax=Oratosquilla oratoria TaxID=337810 RepID=UPI003F767004
MEGAHKYHKLVTEFHLHVADLTRRKGDTSNICREAELGFVEAFNKGCAPRSQPCSLLSRPSGVLPQQHAQELSQGLIQLFHPPGVSPLSETCSSQARSTSPCLMASPKTTKARYNFKGKKGPGSHRTHPQRSQCFTKEPLFGWHGAPAAIATLVPGGSSYERQSPEVYCAIQESELAVSTSQIPSHREVCLYQQNLRPELDNLEKRYSTSASTDPEHRVLQSNPMMHHVLTTMNVRQGLRTVL